MIAMTMTITLTMAMVMTMTMAMAMATLPRFLNTGQLSLAQLADSLRPTLSDDFFH